MFECDTKSEDPEIAPSPTEPNTKGGLWYTYHGDNRWAAATRNSRSVHFKHTRIENDYHMTWAISIMIPYYRGLDEENGHLGCLQICRNDHQASRASSKFISTVPGAID